jgi:hypothetical protein
MCGEFRLPVKLPVRLTFLRLSGSARRPSFDRRLSVVARRLGSTQVGISLRTVWLLTKSSTINVIELAWR